MRQISYNLTYLKKLSQCVKEIGALSSDHQSFLPRSQNKESTCSQLRMSGKRNFDSVYSHKEFNLTIRTVEVLSLAMVERVSDNQQTVTVLRSFHNPTYIWNLKSVWEEQRITQLLGIKKIKF